MPMEAASSSPAPDTLQKLHADLVNWVPHALPAITPHPDLKPWRTLLLDIANKPFSDFTYDKLQQLQQHTATYDALVAEGKATGLAPRSISEYQRSNFSHRIRERFNQHPGNEPYRLIKAFYIKNKDIIARGQTFLSPR